MYSLPPALSEEIKNYGNLIDDFFLGKIEPVKFKAVRVPNGIYEQRKDGTFMVRVRCAGGFILPEQLKQVAEIAEKYNCKILHITTRQEIQIQNVALKNTAQILQNLKEIGLAARGGGGNTVRNIIASVGSGTDPEEVFNVLPYAENLTSKLISESDSYTLPRKFKIAFSNSEADTSLAMFNDLGFIAKIKNGKRGFSVYLGGSLGRKPMTGCRIFDFAPEEDIYYIADAAKKLFSRYGNRKNRHKARLRYVFYRMGNEKVLDLFHSIYNEIRSLNSMPYIHSETAFSAVKQNLVPSAVSSSAFMKWKERFVYPQKQKNLFSLIIPFENGYTESHTLIQIAGFAGNFGDDSIRFSLRQNLHLRNIPEEYLGNAYEFLKSINIRTDEPLVVNNIVSCTGADTCRLGLCLSKGAGEALRKHFLRNVLPLDELKDIRINLSGCPNSCGQQYAADLGFYGKAGRNRRLYPSYIIVAGANIGENSARLAGRIGEIHARELPVFTSRLLSDYLANKCQFPSFSTYVSSDFGRQRIENLLKDYTEVPDFMDDKNYYFDWGSENIFSLVERGSGECSAGLFDLIESDLHTINSLKEELKVNPNNKNEILEKLIYSASRMLLITRGCEPKNDYELFSNFLDKFIESKLISNIYREVIEIRRDNPDFDFSLKESTIIDLADSVIALYHNMDDSLQFHLEETKAPVADISKIITMKKDFRGVACPMNFVKTKIALSALKKNDLLEILLDDGEPVENVPGSVRNEGHIVQEQSKIDNYWKVIIQKQ